MTREEALQLVEKKGHLLEVLESQFQDDVEVVLTAFKNNSYSFCYASERIRDNRNVVLKAVKENPSLLKSVSERLKDDREVVLEAVKRRGYVLR